MEIFQFISSSKISTKKLLSPAFATKTIGYSSTLNGQQNFRKIKKKPRLTWVWIQILCYLTDPTQNITDPTQNITDPNRLEMWYTFVHNETINAFS